MSIFNEVEQPEAKWSGSRFILSQTQKKLFHTAKQLDIKREIFSFIFKSLPMTKIQLICDMLNLSYSARFLSNNGSL